MSRALLALLFALATSIAVLLGRDALFALLTRGTDVARGSEAVLEGCYRFAIYAPILLLALLGCLLFRERPRAGGGASQIGAVLVVGLGAPAVLLAIAFLTGVAVPAAPFLQPVEPGLIVTGSLLIALQVAAEEMMFRGLLQPVLIRAGGRAAGIVLTALAFALVHFAGGWRDPASLANIFLAGLWFGLLAWRTAGLLAPIAAHFGYNWAEELLFAASPNPGHGAFGSIFDVDLAGPAIWGGSVEGLNASLSLSVLLVLFILPLVAGRARAGVVGAAA